MISSRNYLVAIIGVLLLVSCSGDYVKELGNGYALARTNRYNHSIIKEFVMVVDTNITVYAFNDKYVFGRREKPQLFDVDEKLVSDKYGYFVLDKNTGILVEGLTKEEFIAKAKTIGIAADDSVIGKFKKTE
jgi:hypothetical protein